MYKNILVEQKCFDRLNFLGIYYLFPGSFLGSYLGSFIVFMGSIWVV